MFPSTLSFLHHYFASQYLPKHCDALHQELCTFKRTKAALILSIALPTCITTRQKSMVSFASFDSVPSQLHGAMRCPRTNKTESPRRNTSSVLLLRDSSTSKKVLVFASAKGPATHHVSSGLCVSSGKTRSYRLSATVDFLQHATFLASNKLGHRIEQNSSPAALPRRPMATITSGRVIRNCVVMTMCVPFFSDVARQECILKEQSPVAPSAYMTAP